MADYLDVTFNLRDSSNRPVNKTNKEINDIHKQLNHTHLPSLGSYLYLSKNGSSSYLQRFYPHKPGRTN